MKKTVLFVLTILSSLHAFPQDKAADLADLGPGDYFPDVVLDGIRDFSAEKVSLKDYRGKWVFLDFWSKNCGACISSFPHINALQKKFNGQVQYFLVGKEDPENEIRKKYDRFKKTLNLEIAHTFDSSLFKRLDISTCPYVIIIDPKGQVYDFTIGLTADNITTLLSGKQPLLTKAYREHESRPLQYDLDKDAVSDDSTLIFKSALNKWNPLIKGSRNLSIILENGKFQSIADNISNLYVLAYLGRHPIDYRDSAYGYVCDTPILEIADKKKFMASEPDDLYCYRLTLPYYKNTPADVMRAMQNDLKNYFGYDVAMEERTMPYWKLVATDEAKRKLKTKGEKPVYKATDTSLLVRNFPVRKIFRCFSTLPVPVIDETGINTNIDILIHYLPMNLEEIQKGLAAHGLHLLEGTKKIKVLVIRDPVYPGIEN